MLWAILCQLWSTRCQRHAQETMAQKTTLLKLTLSELKLTLNQTSLLSVKTWTGLSTRQLCGKLHNLPEQNFKCSKPYQKFKKRRQNQTKTPYTQLTWKYSTKTSVWRNHATYHSSPSAKKMRNEFLTSQSNWNSGISGLSFRLCSR